MIRGAGDVIDCLEGAIVENMIALVGVKRKDEIKNWVDEFSSAVSNLNYPINNERKDCVPNCVRNPIAHSGHYDPDQPISKTVTYRSLSYMLRGLLRWGRKGLEEGISVLYRMVQICGTWGQ